MAGRNPPQVEVRLLDPGAAVSLAADARMYYETDRCKRAYVYATWPDHQVRLTDRKVEVNAASGMFLGYLTFRRKKKEVALWGPALAGMSDELVETFAQQGLTAVFPPVRYAGRV